MNFEKSKSISKKCFHYWLFEGMILLTALKNLFSRSPILHWLLVSLDSEIPWIEGYAGHMLCPLSSLDSLTLTQSLCLPSVSSQMHGGRRTICVVSLWLHCPSFGISCSASDGVANFTDIFFILEALSKGKGQWNAWPQCNTLLWGVGCWVKWHWGQHCSMPRKEQKLFSLANCRELNFLLSLFLIVEVSACTFEVVLPRAWHGASASSHFINRNSASSPGWSVWQLHLRVLLLHCSSGSFISNIIYDQLGLVRP